MCNTCCFSATTVITRTRLNIMLYVYCLSFSKYLRLWGLVGSVKTQLSYEFNLLVWRWLHVSAVLGHLQVISSFTINKITWFDVFSTVHHSIGLFLQPTLTHNSITTCMSHYYPRHVSGLDMPILRRNNCTITASGILALISGCTLHRLRAEDGHVKARNMSRIVMWHTYCYWIVH